MPDAEPRIQTRTRRPTAHGELLVTSAREGDVHTISIAGELDLATVADVEDELRRVEATDAASIVLDLSRLAFMESTGIGLIVSAHARSRADSDRLTIIRGPAAVERVIIMAGLDELLPFAD